MIFIRLNLEACDRYETITDAHLTQSFTEGPAPLTFLPLAIKEKKATHK